MRRGNHCSTSLHECANDPRPRALPLPRLFLHRPLHRHHVHHWVQRGKTALDNLVLLYPVHHRLAHEDGLDVERLEDGALRFPCLDRKRRDRAQS